MATIVQKADITEEVAIRKIPMLHEVFKAKYFTIKIIEKNGNQYKAKVLSSIREEFHQKGEIFDIEEIAFQSDYYVAELM